MFNEKLMLSNDNEENKIMLQYYDGIERQIGFFFDEPIYQITIKTITPPNNTSNTIINLSTYNIKQVVEYKNTVYTDTCYCSAGGVGSIMQVWYRTQLKTLVIGVNSTYTPYFNSPIWVTLVYTKN